jgi:hypothetical protein
MGGIAFFEMVRNQIKPHKKRATRVDSSSKIISLTKTILKRQKMCQFIEL